MRRRKITERIVQGLMVLSLGALGLCFLSLLLLVVFRGLHGLTPAMLLETPKGGFYLGKEGGIANAIVGSLLLSIGATLLSLAVGLPLAFALQREYSSARMRAATRLMLDVLWGTPSIVFGAFGFVIMQLVGLRTSLLAGTLTLALVILPIMVRTMEEVLRMIPPDFKETVWSLGLTRTEAFLRVLSRQALPGFLMAILLAFGRGIGDAASILFTAGYTDNLPSSLLDPVASLPLSIFFQISTPIAEVQDRGYASALVLLVLVILVQVVAFGLNRRFSRHLIR